ncbi:MAG TPA: protein kinase [Pyrinomonadaceae bacterium]|nr:protein kinase [Pyrinomonadaceae bacterium]
MVTAAGTLFGRYEIRSPLGAGGMGEVYLARDTRLDRLVALKLLTAEVTRYEDRLLRFEQEARAASALNHPNILTIYEIGQSDAGHFIVTEFIDGETLRQRMSRGKVGTAEALEIALQVSAALTAAHAAGIVHRDIKPENIMLRRDGYVKVLDFGLAKLAERGIVDSEAATRSPLKTDPKTVMGTVGYMSPEQARGLEVDARTDVWSLGVVLYETLAGRAPFEGPTGSDVIVSILDREPPPLARYSVDVPGEMEWIVKKALSKDREERYQTIKDFAVDLRRLKHELEFRAKLERSTPSGEGMMVTASGGQVYDTDRNSAARTGELGMATHTASSAEYLIGEIKRHKGGAALTLAAVAIVVAGIAFGLHSLLKRDMHYTPFQNMRISRLTNTGRANGAAISPDGKYVVHVVSEAGQQSLWVRQVATSSNVQIAPPAEVRYWGLTFSRDGNYVYYVVSENSTHATLYQVPVLGGAPKKLIEDVDSSITISPDGARLAFVREHPKTGERSLMIAKADGTAEQKLATRKLPSSFLEPAWSPDGKVIAASVKNHDAKGFYTGLVGVGVEDGTETPISTQRWLAVGRPAWLRDGSGLIMTAADQASRLSQVWHLSYPGGESRRITNDLNDYRGISITSDSSALVTIQKDQLSNIWTMTANGEASRANQITSGKYNGWAGFSWTPDGKIVYTSNASGNPDIWIMEADGTGQKQLTANAGANFYPSVSADGRYIVFISDRTDALLIWRMNIDGSNLKQLAGGKAYHPQCSPDSRWVVYESFDSGQWTLWKTPIDGGDPVQLTDKMSSSPAISPDGKLIAYYYADEQTAWQRKMAIMPFDGGPPVKVFDVPPSAGGVIKWTPDGRAMTYVDTRGGVSNVWSQPLDGGPPKQLTDFKADQIFFFDWSGDGKQLATSRGLVITDVVLIGDFK